MATRAMHLARARPQALLPSPNLAFLQAAHKSAIARLRQVSGRTRPSPTRASSGAWAKPRLSFRANDGEKESKPVSQRKRTAAEKRARRQRKKQFMTVFINGKQKRVPRPPLVDGLPVEEFLARNADPLWLHENERWELMLRGPEDQS